MRQCKKKIAERDLKTFVTLIFFINGGIDSKTDNNKFSFGKTIAVRFTVFLLCFFALNMFPNNFA